jgi:hypothetical protein
MSALVTGVMDERTVNRALLRLTALPIAREKIYLASPTLSSQEAGSPGGEAELPDSGRDFPSTRIGLTLGATAGVLVGLGVGVLGQAINRILQYLDWSIKLSAFAVNLWWSTLSGFLIGAVVGGFLGWSVNRLLSWIESRALRPGHETRLSVECDNAMLSQVCHALQGVRVRHVEVLFVAKS